jgi:CBS domain containing-hemolysin-like protein
MHLEEVNERLNLDLPLTDEYQTLGGFLLYQWQKIPTLGEVICYDGYEFQVTSAEGPRLHQIQIQRIEAEGVNGNLAVDSDGIPNSLNPDAPESSS